MRSPANEAARRLDRRTVDGVRHAVDLERQRPGRQLEERGLAAAEHDRLHRLAGAHDARLIALGEQVVQRTLLEVEGEQARKSLGGQTGLLQNQRLAATEPNSLDVGDGGILPRSRVARPRYLRRARSGR